MSGSYRLGIRGGILVGAKGRQRTNLYIDGGKIAAIDDGVIPAAECVDADGLLVMPGMVDSHVHLMDPGDTTREDFPAGTAAAACAGVTTIVEHTHARPVLNANDLLEKVAYLEDRARVDYALAAHVLPERLEAIAELADGGVAFFKAFTCTTHGIPGFSPARLQELFRAIAERRVICLVHCEDESLTAAAETHLRATARGDGAILPEWRSREAEAVAVAYTSFLGRTEGARVVIAHVSNMEPLRGMSAERSLGADVYAETCPQYLRLYEHEVITHGALRKFTPPARARSSEDLADMWRAVREGSIAIISSDHAPATLEQKRAGSIWDVHFGLPGLDTTFPLLLTAAAEGCLSYERVVEVYSTSPAALYGLAPRKGQLRVGADADVVLVDPSSRWVLTRDHVRSRAGWSPYEGTDLCGRVVRAYCRGQLISEDGEVRANPGTGEFVRAVHR